MYNRLIVSIAVILLILASGCLTQSGEKSELPKSSSITDKYQLSDPSQEKGANSP
jgi:hypothetical protein